MPYDFTSLGGNDITWSLTTTAFADNRTTFVSGWWRPTVLASTERLWSIASNALTISPTGQLRLITSNATTNGVWDTSDAGLAVDEWRFVALLVATENTGVLAAHCIWTGSISEAPVERATTQTTAPVGNFSGSASFYIGNNATAGALGFGGQIADVSVITTDASYAATIHPLGLATSGAITNTEALHVYQTLVLPLWLGDTSVLFFRSTNISMSTWHNGLDIGAIPHGNIRNLATIMPITITIDGAVPSQYGAPRPRAGPAMWPDRRR